MQIGVGGEVSLRLALGGKMNEFRVYYERHLPHYQPSDGMLFITFRLAGSLPVHVIEQVYREAQFVEQQLAAIADGSERARTAHAQHLRIFGYWDAALDNNPDAPRWLCSYQLLRVLPRAYTGEMIDWDYALSAYCIMPTHVHLVAKPLCDGLCDQESSERRASCRTEGLAIYLRCRPNVGRSGTSPALAPKDHCPDKQVGVKWHFFALQSLRPTNIPSHPVCTESTARRAKWHFALHWGER